LHAGTKEKVTNPDFYTFTGTTYNMYEPNSLHSNNEVVIETLSLYIPSHADSLMR